MKTMKRAVIRVDSSYEIGSGHVMRCLSLAQRLRDKNIRVCFVCLEFPGNINSFIEKAGFEVHRLQLAGADRSHRIKFEKGSFVTEFEDAQEVVNVLKDKNADLLVVDHYWVDFEWERRVRPHVERLMVIDDYGTRRHYCDILLDQNLYRKSDRPYEGLVPHNCELLIGPEYALIRPQFKKARENLRKRDGKIERILIAFGGMDHENVTTMAIKAISEYTSNGIRADVVVGAKNPHKEMVKDICKQKPNITYHCQVSEMAQLMVRSDIALGATGISAWERCCVGLPSLVITLADNQEKTAEILSKKGVVLHLGSHHNVLSEQITSAFGLLIENAEMVKEMSLKGLDLVDGSGCERIVERLLDREN